MRSRNIFKKNIAILVCAAFISVSLPGVSLAKPNTPSSSTKIPFLKKHLTLFPAVISLLNLNSPFGVNDYLIMNILSKDEKNLPNDGSGSKKDKKKKDSYFDHGNSLSRKPPNTRD